MVARSVVPLVVVVGETASGKSDLAMLLAEQFSGEIITADSRTIYRGMDIGTAKPSKDDQRRVAHHLIDVAEPNERYTVAQFKQDANQAIQEISQRGHLPILVGGSGLYVDAVIYDYSFGDEDLSRRQELDELTLQQLQALATDIGISQEDIDFKNRRHLQRAVERGQAGRHDQTLRDNTLILGVRRDGEELDSRIEQRIDTMITNGLVEEVQKLFSIYGDDAEAIRGTGYQPFIKYLKGELSMEEARQQFIQADKRLAKRQRTWFRRNKSIHYPLKQSEAVDLVTTLLSKN